MKKLFSFALSFLVVAVLILFMAVPQALSRSPDTRPILILNIGPLATFQAIENQLFYSVTNYRQEIIPLENSPAQTILLTSIGHGIAKMITRPILLL